MKYFRLFIICFVIISCSQRNKLIPIEIESITVLHKKKQQLSKTELKNWLTKDINVDTIPGISLSKASKKLQSRKGKDTVIVALIDMPLDINHKELKNHIWINKKEISDNQLDDDGNGYVDDVNGWNFLGNEQGENIIFMNYEYTRILKPFERDNSVFRNHGKRAEKKFNERMSYANQSLKNATGSETFYFSIKNKILSYLNEEIITEAKLDSLLDVNTDKELIEAIETYKLFLDEGVDDNYIAESLLLAKQRLSVLLNTEFNDRSIIGDNVNDIHDLDYGNNMISHNLELMEHGTLMAGIITSSYKLLNLEQVMGMIKIMPLCVSGFGDENDKDLALAIKYAADNGANIINISSGKYFSMHEDWVQDAIKYANEMDVLIVTSSGNDGFDLDDKDTFRYPNDMDLQSGLEISDNFIRVGSSSNNLDSTLVSPTSNYGNSEVDIFAPGEQIYTTSVDNKYTFTSGTSAATAVVSKIAAILKSYYPELSVSELKYILLNSGIRYNLSIKMKDSTGQDTSIPFENLSKSGSILNADKALELAEIMTK